MTTFRALGMSEAVLKGVHAAGYSTPTPIQADAIPLAVAGSDLIGCAQTGTGKTAAFVLPLLHRLSLAPAANGRGARALVVAPTRELAMQVNEAVRTYGRFTNHRSLAVYGGVPIGPQIKALRRTVDIVVATPGRLLDLMERGHADLSGIEVLVLDEADRMLDMGFLPDIRKIIAATPRSRQTMLFSATMPDEVQKFARSILRRNAQSVEVGEQRNPAETVVQHACTVAQHRKMNLLFHVLEHEPVEHVLVFSRTKRRADRITKGLSKKGFAVTALHSNKSQNQRQRALHGFRRGQYKILVATDIAARGIDVETISHVINYDTPNQAEDYIHRIGRTGRAEASGDAITFVAREEEAYLRNIERHTGQRLARKVYGGFDDEQPDESPEPSSEPNTWNEPKPRTARRPDGRPDGRRPRNGRPGNQNGRSGNQNGRPRNNGGRKSSRRK